MDNNWFTGLAFAFGWEANKQRKAEKAHQAYLAERREGLCSSVAELSDTFSKLVIECGPIGYSDEIVDESKLALFYGICEVLSAQGTIFSEQETALKILLANLNPTYNYAQLTEAAIYRTGIYEQYRSIVGLEEKGCGSFWLTIFELIYRSRLLDTLQKIDDQLSLIVINFAFLGDSNSPLAKPICDRILSNLNTHINAYQQTPYIHGLILLQNVLADQCNLGIEEHFLLRDTDMIKDDRNYYVFAVYEKSTQAYFGKFAVREINVVNGELDYEHDKDMILAWNEAGGEYKLLYQE